MKTTFIYFLKDPENPMKGYVGKTGRLKKRLFEHLLECRTQKHYRANWLKALAARNLKPTLEVVDEVPFEHWKQLEVAYIEFFLEQGYKLTNGTPGGEDPPVAKKGHTAGRKQSPEEIAKRVAKITGQKRTPAQCAKISARQRGIKRTPEEIIKRTATRRLRDGYRIGIKNARNTSGFAGVYWNKGAHKWQAYFTHCGKILYAGIFSKIEDAVFARALAMDKYFSI